MPVSCWSEAENEAFTAKDTAPNYAPASQSNMNDFHYTYILESTTDPSRQNRGIDQSTSFEFEP